MKDLPRATALARALVRVGTRAGKRVVALLTDMQAPLGAAVGNAIETREAFDVLTGAVRAPDDLVACTLDLGVEMLLLGGAAKDADDARARLAKAIASGEAAAVAEKMIAAQGGDPRVVADRGRLEVARETMVVESPRDGFVQHADALTIGLAGVAMGAGRTRADQAVDHAVGILVDAKPGARVARGQPLARVLVREKNDAAAAVVARVASAFTVGDASPPQSPLLIGRIDARESTTV